MPFDTKRINGPEQSYSYWHLVEKKKKPDKIKGKREDGRKWDEARKFGEIRYNTDLYILVELNTSQQKLIGSISLIFQLLSWEQYQQRKALVTLKMETPKSFVPSSNLEKLQGAQNLRKLYYHRRWLLIELSE